MAVTVPTKLLKDGYKIPVLGLGTYLCDGEPVKWALEEGYRLIDTASLYNNEKDVGNALKVSGLPREEVCVVTKLWNTEHGKKNTLDSFQRSLDQLGLEYVDLYLMHSAMGGKTIETWDTMVELKERGLIRSLGVANFNIHHLKALQKARPDNMPVVNQVEIHPFLAWDECVSFCRKEGIAIMAYSPLAKAEKMSDHSLCRIAKKYSKSPAQIMIKWSLQEGFICIPKSSNRARISENFNVFDFEIAGEDMQTLRDLDQHYISDWPGAMDSRWVP